MIGENESPRRLRALPAPEAGTPGPVLSILLLFGFLGFVFIFAATACWVAENGIEGWYPTIEKPPFTPPGWVLPLIWNVLYFLMGLSGWLVWRSAGGFAAAGAAMALFAAQVMLNFSWSVILFGIHSAGGATIEIFLLIAAILATLIAFWRINVFAAVLLLPYLAWSLFAAYLTVAIWLLNR